MLQPSGQSKVEVVGLARTADGTLHVAFPVKKAANDYDLRVRSVSAGGLPGAVHTALADWVSIDSAFLGVATEGLRVFTDATHSLDSHDPNTGLITSTSQDGIAWTPPAVAVTGQNTYAYARVPSATVGFDGTWYQSWYGVSQTLVHRGLDPNATDSLYLPAGNGTCCSTNQAMATDRATGRVLVAWCTSTSGSAHGVWAQVVDGATGAPLAGTQQRMPGSVVRYQGRTESSCPVTARNAIAARAGGGVYLGAIAGYPTNTAVWVWRYGAAHATRVAFRRNVAHDIPALSAVSDGRLWAAWLERQDNGNVIVLRRSNRTASAWGEPVTLRPPKGQRGIDALDISSAPGGGVDVVALIDTSAGAPKLWQTRVSPRLTFVANPRSWKRQQATVVKLRVLDASTPVSGATVKVGKHSATTGPDGRAELTLGPYKHPVTLHAKATHSGYAPATLALSAR